MVEDGVPRTDMPDTTNYQEFISPLSLVTHIFQKSMAYIRQLVYIWEAFNYKEAIIMICIFRESEYLQIR